MTSTMQSEQSARDGLALFLAAQVQQALKEGATLTPEYFQAAFSAFEYSQGEIMRVSVVRRGDIEKAGEAVAEKAVAAAAPNLQGAARESAQADPAAFVHALVQENEELKAEVRESSMILEMHKELVGAVKDLVKELERAPEVPEHLAAVKALVARAESARIGEQQIPSGVSPFRILATMEKLVDSHSAVIVQYGRNLPGAAVASCVRVLADAKNLLEEIHGQASPMQSDSDQDYDEDHVRPHGA